MPHWAFVKANTIQPVFARCAFTWKALRKKTLIRQMISAPTYLGFIFLMRKMTIMMAFSLLLLLTNLVQMIAMHSSTVFGCLTAMPQRRKTSFLAGLLRKPLSMRDVLTSGCRNGAIKC